MKYKIQFLRHTSHFEVSVYASQLPVLYWLVLPTWHS